MAAFDRSHHIQAEDEPASLNPYAAPSGITEQTPLAVDRLPSSPSWFPWLITGSALAYLGFTVLLLTSSHPNDQRSGCWFLFNLPIWLTWIVTQWLLREEGFWIGVLTIVIQSLICAAMLIAGIGDLEIVLIINGFILGWVGGLCFLCRWLPRREFQKSIGTSSQFDA